MSASWTAQTLSYLGKATQQKNVGDSAAIAALSTLYITMVGAGFRAFDCVYQDGTMRLEGDFAIDCGFDTTAELWQSVVRAPHNMDYSPT